MTPTEILLALGPDKSIALHEKVYEQFDQPFRAVGIRSVGTNYDVDVVLKNGERRTVTV